MIQLLSNVQIRQVKWLTQYANTILQSKSLKLILNNNSIHTVISEFLLHGFLFSMAVIAHMYLVCTGNCCLWIKISTTCLRHGKKLSLSFLSYNHHFHFIPIEIGLKINILSESPWAIIMLQNETSHIHFGK